MSISKNKKKSTQKYKKGTLDQKHTEKIHKFEKLNSSLPLKKRKLQKYKLELDKLSKLGGQNSSHDDVHRRSQLLDNIQKLENEINSIENYNEPLNYIATTLPILIDYYDNESVIGDDLEEEILNEAPSTGKKNILSYFFKDITPDELNKKPVSQQDTSLKRVSRAKLYDNYLSATDVNYKISPDKKSNICGENGCDGQKIINQNDSYMVCTKCGLSKAILVTTDKSNYRDQPQDCNTYAYRRINHLTEILSQLQAKESTEIPSEVYQEIFREIKKYNINKNELDMFGLRRILKKLNLRKYYEHVPHILQNINGKEPPNFSRDDENEIKKMFKAIQKPFSIFCPKDRKNFLNYSYVLHKFCELLGLDEYIDYFPLLKNNAKLKQHDRIWEKICNYMKWEYIKSI